MRSRALALLLAASWAGAFSCKDERPTPTRAPVEVTERAPATLEERVRKFASVGVDKHWIRGAAISIIRPGREPSFVFVGDDGRGASLTELSVFEIGSITKVFTGLLLADASIRGEVNLDDEVAKVTSLPVPTFAGHGPTLLQLSRHSSGLPRLPANLGVSNIDDPYRHYGREQLRDYLRSASLPRAPGKAYEYSNLAVGLLGGVLAERAGTDYASLVRERITSPLGLSDTVVRLTPSQAKRAAVGHNGMLDAVPMWTRMGALDGAGALRSTLADMTRFMAVQLEPSGSLAEAIRLSQKLGDGGGKRLGLGWHGDSESGLWHNGQTGGFYGYVAIDGQRRAAVVVLANTASTTVDGLGRAVIEMAVGREPGYEWP